MSTQDYIAQLDLDQLHYFVETAKARIKALEEVKKEEYLVVSDDCINLGFFRKDNLEGALRLFNKRAASGVALRHNRDELQIRVERWYPHVVEDMIQEDSRD